VRLQRQVSKLQGQVPAIEDQAKKALGIGREDLARLALQRKQSVLAESAQLEQQVAEVAIEEQRLTQTEQELAARIEEFRIRRDSLTARYSAAQAQVKVSEALSGVSGEFAELGMAMGRAVEKTERMQARASAIGSLIESGSLALPSHGTDPVERDLLAATVDSTVEDELAALKGQIGDTPPALPSGK
jgi:phage shock protein A